MKRAFKIGAGLVVAVIVAAVVGVLVFIDPLAKAAIEGLGSKTTGTRVTLAQVDIRPLTGTGTLRGLRIANPDGFKTESAVRVGEIRIAIDSSSITGDLVVIREILIDAPKITYELGSDGSNFDAIQKNIVRFMSGAAGAGGDSAQTAAGKEEAGKEDAGGKKLMIATFVIQGGKIDVSASGLAGSNLTVALPRIHINNIGRNKGGASPGAVAQKVFAEITGKVKGAVLPLGIGGALGAVEKRVKGLTEAVGKGAEGVTETVKEGIEGAGKAIGKGVESIGGALKGLFGK